MRNRLLPRLAISVAAVAPAAALLVSPGSPCSASCGNTLSSTSPDELVCSEGGYTGTSTGTVFQNCITCETTSSYSSGDDTDVGSLLYNLRLNVGYCMWGEDLGNRVESNPCLTSTACLPLRHAIEHGNYSTMAGSYDYCDKWDGFRVSACTTCLNNLDNGFYLRNYITMLDAGCIQRPGNGSTLAIAGSPFQRRPVNITDPLLNLASLPLPDYGPVSLGARVGIAFGGLALLLALLGCCIVLNGKRRRRAFLRTLERQKAGLQPWPPHHLLNPRGNDMLETPASQKPLTGWNTESPVSAFTESPVSAAAPRYFSPYSSLYNSPVSGGGAGSASWPALVPQQQQQQGHSPPPPAFSQWPSPTQEKLMMQLHHEQRQNEIAIGLALGGDQASLRSKASSGSMNNNPYTNGSYVPPPPPPGPPPGRSASGNRKGKGREEEAGGYEMESPYSGGTRPQGGYKMPIEPGAPVLHHPGYGRHHQPGRG